jgi:ribosomal protein L12E/L44/L45/RPP1/RPP2
MAINKNHEFEDLDNIKCSIVEKNASADRIQFLKDLLSYNKYEVIVVASPAPKAAPAPASASAPAPAPATATTTEGEGTKAADESGKLGGVATNPEPIAPTTFTIGVTDLRFNPTNAVFGRSLHTPNGQVVTLAYWNQEVEVSDDTVPYFEQKK